MNKLDIKSTTERFCVKVRTILDKVKAKPSLESSAIVFNLLKHMADVKVTDNYIIDSEKFKLRRQYGEAPRVEDLSFIEIIINIFNICKSVESQIGLEDAAEIVLSKIQIINYAETIIREATSKDQIKK